jgi:hypothetical protein
MSLSCERSLRLIINAGGGDKGQIIAWRRRWLWLILPVFCVCGRLSSISLSSITARADGKAVVVDAKETDDIG